jgi:hypothetical protein
MVEQVPPGEPWPGACYNDDVMALAAWAIPLGRQVSIGLGETTTATASVRRPTPTWCGGWPAWPRPWDAP